MTLAELVNAEPALQRLSAQALPIKTAYQLAKMLTSVRAEIAYFHAQRNAFIKELGVTREPTTAEREAGYSDMTEVKPENVTEFLRRLNELGAIEVDFKTFVAPIPSAILGEITITPADLIALGALIAE